MDFCTLKELNPTERRRLISIAYGYLGSLIDAEDAVQDALLRFEQADRAEIRNPEAWLTTVVTRICIDKLRSAEHRREVYPGEWLPEPVFNGPTPEQEAITRSRLSMGLLYLLEKLDPEQRAVFVLREVFEYPYQEIAEIVRKSEAACRQMMVRAKAALGRVEAPSAVSEAVASSVLTRFIDAVAQGDERALLEVLSPDALLVADGGGKVKSVLNPLHGSRNVAKFFLGVRRKVGVLDVRPATVNGGPGLLTYQDGKVTGASAITIEDGRITAIHAVTNPDKLLGNT